MGKKAVYKKEYKMRKVGDGGFEATIPIEVIRRAAAKAGMEPEEFVKTHKVAHLYNDFKDFDAAYKFVPDEPTEEVEDDTELVY